MTKHRFTFGVILVVCSLTFSPFVQAAPTRITQKSTRAMAFARLPLSFEANRGQSDSQVKFLSRGKGYTLFLTGNEAVLKLSGTPRYSDFASSSAGTQSRKPGTPAGSSLVGSVPDSTHAAGANAATEVLRMRLFGANTSAKVSGSEELPGKSNYFIGTNPKNWRTNVDNFAKVKYEGIYPAIDVVYYGNQGQLENDFVVAPGADPNKIRLDVAGRVFPSDRAEVRTRTRLDAKGDLIVRTGEKEVTLHKPVAYQLDRSGKKRFVESRYVLLAQNSAEKSSIISFEVPNYDRSKVLVIDPTLVYSSYLGGSGLDGGSTVNVAVDSSGSAYFAGATLSTDFPVTPGAVQTSFGGAGPQRCAGGVADCGDATITKINPSGTAIVYSTYLGGSLGDSAYGLAVDSAGNAYLTGNTESSNFPTTPGAFQSTLNNGLGPAVCGSNNNPDGPSGSNPCPDVFVAKIDSTGSKLLYSTLLGGSGSDEAQGIVVDSLGNAYVTGGTNSADFPTSVGAFQAVEPCSGSVCVNAFVTKLSPDGIHLIYSTYLGNGSSSAFAIALDSAGDAYVDGWITGVTPLTFPTTASAFQTMQNIPSTGCYTFQPYFAFHCYDGFLTKLDATGSRLLYSTIIGGTGNEFLNGVAVDSQGDAYITGFTNSPDFPVTPGTFQTTFPGSICQADSFFGAYCPDVFVSKFDPSKSGAASLVYSTFLGGSGNQDANDVVVDAMGNAYVSGATSSLDFPVVAPLQAALADGVDCNSSSSFFSGSCADAFVAELNSTGSSLIFSTYLGGTKLDYSDFLALDSQANIYVAGSTASSDFPTTPGAFQPNYAGAGDFFLAKIAPVTVTGLGSPLAALSLVGSPVVLPDHAFKQGSTLPLKLQLFMGSTLLTGATTASPQITGLVRNGNAVNLTTIDPDSGQANDNGTLFRSSGQDWVFNLSTKGLTTGTYTLTIQVYGGLSYNAGFVLR